MFLKASQLALGLLWTLQAAATTSQCTNLPGAHSQECAGRLGANEDVLSALQLTADILHRGDHKIALSTSSTAIQEVRPDGQSQIMVKVPDQAKPGDSIQATSPDGQTLQFQLPAEALPGQLVPVLYKPLHPQQVSGQANVMASASAQPVLMDALGDSASIDDFDRASSKADNDAMETAMMQNTAVKNVMSDYATMASMEDVDVPSMTAYLHAKDIQKMADWETAADLASANAEAEAANFNAWKRSNALQMAAMAKHELAQEAADYSVTRANTVAVAGTDAAWKSSMQPAAPSIQQSAPPMQQSVLAASAMQQSAPPMQQATLPAQLAPELVSQQSPQAVQQSAPAAVPAVSATVQTQAAGSVAQPKVGATLEPQSVQIPVVAATPAVLQSISSVKQPRQIREDSLKVKPKPTLTEIQRIAERRSIERGVDRDEAAQEVAARRMEQSILQLDSTTAQRAPLEMDAVNPMMLEEARRTMELEDAAANAARAKLADLRAFEEQEHVSPTAWAEAEEIKRKSRLREAQDLAVADAVKEVTLQRSAKKAEALQAAAHAKYNKAIKAAEYKAAVKAAGSGDKLVGYDADHIVGAAVQGKAVESKAVHDADHVVGAAVQGKAVESKAALVQADISSSPQLEQGATTGILETLKSYLQTDLRHTPTILIPCAVALTSMIGCAICLNAVGG